MFKYNIIDVIYLWWVVVVDVLQCGHCCDKYSLPILSCPDQNNRLPVPDLGHNQSDLTREGSEIMRLAVWFLVLHTVWALPLQQNTRETAENEELQYSSQSQHNADYEELETGVQLLPCDTDVKFMLVFAGLEGRYVW